MNADGYFGEMGELLSSNIFSYCKNNPINKSDPNGHVDSSAMTSITGALICLTEVVGEVIVAVAASPVAIGLVAIGVVGAIVYTGYECYNYFDSNDSKSTTYGKSKDNTSNLPNQNAVSGNVKGAPSVDAGKQGKHVSGHPNNDPTKSQWPKGETGVDETQEAWLKGMPKPNNPNVKIWDAGKVVGRDGQTKVNVKYSPSDGLIHGFPTW